MPRSRNRVLPPVMTQNAYDLAWQLSDETRMSLFRAEQRLREIREENRRAQQAATARPLTYQGMAIESDPVFDDLDRVHADLANRGFVVPPPVAVPPANVAEPKILDAVNGIPVVTEMADGSIRISEDVSRCALRQVLKHYATEAARARGQAQREATNWGGQVVWSTT